MKTLVIVLFIAMVIAQLFVPAKMIFDSEDVVRNGTAYRFKTQPIDPLDPFRGRYIALHFHANHIPDENQWSTGEPVNVVFGTDSLGFAVPIMITRDIPDGDYLRTKVSYTLDSPQHVFIDLPFDRFYMEENIAMPAEVAYAEAVIDTSAVCYGMVSIGKGQAVLQNVYINDRPISEAARQQLQQKTTDD